MSDFRIGKLEFDVKFMVTLFVIVVVSYLILSGELDPIEIWNNVVKWIGEVIQKTHKQ